MGSELYQKRGGKRTERTERAFFSPIFRGAARGSAARGGGRAERGALLGCFFVGFGEDEFLGGIVVGELLDFLIGEPDGHGGHQGVGAGAVAVSGEGFDEVFGVLSGDVGIDGLGAHAGDAVAGDADGDFAVGDGHILRQRGGGGENEEQGGENAGGGFHGWMGVG